MKVETIKIFILLNCPENASQKIKITYLMGSSV